MADRTILEHDTNDSTFIDFQRAKLDNAFDELKIQILVLKIFLPLTSYP